MTLALFFPPFLSQAQNGTKPEADSPTLVMRSATAADRGDLAARVKAMEQASCNDSSRHFDHRTTVGDFVGAKVKTIRVVHYVRQRKNPKGKEIETLVRKVWRGNFDVAYCAVVWAEHELWCVESTVEFEDGKQGVLITDGSHVALRDHDGKNWFFRLLPAAQ
jgi:hypothetical protein